MNSTDHVAARDVVLTVVLADGQALSAEMTLMDYNPPELSALRLRVEYTEPIAIDDKWFAEEPQGFEYATVEFSDVRSVGRWQQRWTVRPRSQITEGSWSMAYWVGSEAELVA